MIYGIYIYIYIYIYIPQLWGYGAGFGGPGMGCMAQGFRGVTGAWQALGRRRTTAMHSVSSHPIC